MTLEVLSALNLLIKCGICSPEEVSEMTQEYIADRDTAELMKRVSSIKARTEEEEADIYMVIDRLSSIEDQRRI